ncbi:hypothetical protein CXB51_022760 [Gossypium anomalum]|uniref:Uncharacterized protein n=1 Tax=Gossypium anomalum TaxID=47600 RepID=A0A8J6CY33_9ROSI|nr:hypothetical protein CXB51_022760 [Gossypium anomalum]
MQAILDGYAVIGSASSTDWGAVCYELLGVILNNINRGRIEIGWLQDTFPELDNDLTELERIRYAQAYILEMIRGYLMPDLSRNLGDATEQSQNRRLPITTAIMGTVSLSIFMSLSRPPIYISTHNEVFDDEHKVDLRQLHTDWPRFWSYYIEMWENRYDYIPIRESIIVPELACVAEYMP